VFAAVAVTVHGRGHCRIRICNSLQVSSRSLATYLEQWLLALAGRVAKRGEAREAPTHRHQTAVALQAIRASGGSWRRDGRAGTRACCSQ